MAKPVNHIVRAELWTAVTLRDAFGYGCSISPGVKPTDCSRDVASFFREKYCGDSCVPQLQSCVHVLLSVWAWGGPAGAATHCTTPTNKEQSICVSVAFFLFKTENKKMIRGMTDSVKFENYLKCLKGCRYKKTIVRYVTISLLCLFVCLVLHVFFLITCLTSDFSLDQNGNMFLAFMLDNFNCMSGVMFIYFSSLLLQLLRCFFCFVVVVVVILPLSDIMMADDMQQYYNYMVKYIPIGNQDAPNCIFGSAVIHFVVQCI